MKKTRVRYWTMMQGGSVVCDSAKTFKKALEKAELCEAGGGTYHQIFKVVEVKRPRKKEPQ